MSCILCFVVCCIGWLKWMLVCIVFTGACLGIPGAGGERGGGRVSYYNAKALTRDQRSCFSSPTLLPLYISSSHHLSPPNQPHSHNGHMIKFQFFEKSSSLNCHFKNLGTFVVSIAHYMRAYFNQQALIHGNNFHLPGDVGFLNVSSYEVWMAVQHQLSGFRIRLKAN